jgi:hypothetical protein
MRVAIHQPQYWPWPPYINKILICDTFVYLDTVQFSKNGLQNRNRIKTSRGPAWFTLPVAHRLGQRLLDTRLSDPRALARHWKTLEANYAGTPGFRRWREELRRWFERQNDRLCDVAIASTEWLLDKLEIRVRRIRASEMTGPAGSGSALVASICASLGATSYLAGEGGLEYMRPDDFARIGCRVWIQKRCAWTYDQVFPEAGFASELSTLDLLLNCPDGARDIVAGCAHWTRLSDIR